MGRRKKQEIEANQSNSSGVHGDVKRSVVAVFLFALAIIFLLGFIGNGGSLGSGLNKLAGMVFGWGKWLAPFVFIAAGVVLLFRKETLFYVSKLLGLGSAFLSLLGFFHIFFSSGEMLSIAKTGSGGGFLGYAISIVLIKLTGKIGGGVILFALLLVGLIVAFNFSIVTFFEKLIKRKVNLEEENEEEQEEQEEEILNPVIEQKNKKEEDGEETVEFVKDPNEDQPKESVIRKAAQWLPKRNKKTDDDEIEWEFPDVDLLEKSNSKAQGGDVKKNAKIIQDTFKHFGIEVEPGEIQTGPTVTQYSFRPAVGVKLTRITSLSNDLALALAAHPIRIEAPIPGKSLIGIEVPNKVVATVRMPELLECEEFEERQTNLLLALGKDVSGNYIFGDLKKMPHLLIAGSTNSGKSVCVNTILISMLYQNSPDDLKLILVDPKRVELSLYNGIPHLLADVIVENGKVISALKWAIGEMERRYKLLPETGSRDIMSYNKKVENGETKKVVDSETNETREEPLEKLPYIVIVIDELADLMATHGKEVEGAIIRLAQMARAVGIHLIVSTQRPDVSVLTGLIKANIATRIAFRVPTQIDSRTILDSAGAEKLLGNGDMLFSTTTGIRRLQGVFVSESEVKKVVDFIKKQKKNRVESLGESIDIESEGVYDTHGNGEVVSSFNSDKIDFSAVVSDEAEDSLYEEAKNIVIQAGKASSSLLQRRLRVGYSRAARLIDMLEDNGIIGAADGAKPREILAGKSEGPSYDDHMMDQVQRDKWQM